MGSMVPWTSRKNLKKYGSGYVGILLTSHFENLCFFMIERQRIVYMALDLWIHGVKLSGWIRLSTIINGKKN